MKGTDNLKLLYRGLYLNITFLFVRNIFRFIEFTQNTVLGLDVSPDTYVLANQQVRLGRVTLEAIAL